MDVLAKCLTSVTRNALFMQVDMIANGLRNSYVRHLGGTLGNNNRRVGDQD